MQRSLLLAGIAVGLLFAQSTLADQKLADVILHNAEFYTVNEKQPLARAVAIKDGKFLAVGSEKDVRKYRGAETEVIDLEGRFVIPGLVEAHTHGIEDFYPPLFLLDLDTTDQDSLLRSVKKYADDNPDKKWIIGGMWPNGMFKNDSPTREMLDEVLPDRPAYLLDQSAHSAWLNSKAIEISGLDDPKLALDSRAVVERDKSGRTTGTIREFAMGHVKRFMPPRSQENLAETVRQMQSVYHGYGITATKLAAEPLANVKAASVVEKEGKLKMHLKMSMTYDKFDVPSTPAEDLKDIEDAKQYASELIDPTSIKLFVDGTQLASAAWNVKPYHDNAENFGTGYYTPEEIQEMVDWATERNISVMAHLCGSRSVREFLNAVEKAKKKFPKSTVRHQPTHNIQIEPEDRGRFKELQLAAELSPIMIMNPGLVKQLESKMSREVLDNEMWPARAIIDAGSVLALASDWNVSPLNPWNIMEYVVTRENEEFPEMGKIAPNSAITVGEAIRAYTYGGAYAIGWEDKLGTIEPGKSADLAVLDRNLIEEEKKGQQSRINETKILYTVFRGEVVYENVEATMPLRNREWQANKK